MSDSSETNEVAEEVKQVEVKKKRGRPSKADLAAREQAKLDEYKKNNPVPSMDDIFYFYNEKKASDRAATILMVGKSGRGKTYTTKYLIDYITRGMHKFKFGLVFAKSSFNGDWSFMPDNAVVQGWNQQVFEKYIQRLEEMRKELGDNMPCSFMVLDDLFGTKELISNGAFESFCSRSRHLGVTLFILVQYLNSATSSTILREQASHVFMFYSKTARTIDSFYQWFGQEFKSVDAFKEYMEHRIGKDLNSCILYIEKNEGIDNNYYCFKAPGPDHWHMTEKYHFGKPSSDKNSSYG